MASLFDNPPLRVSQCRHGPMMYLTNDLIGRSLDLYGEFAEQEMQVFERYVRPGAVVLDVGANIGTHTLRLSQLAGPEGLVLCFEPQRAIYQMLSGNLALNRVKNVRAYHAAVGATRGTIETPPIDYGQPGAFNFGAVRLGGQVEYPPGGETVTLVTLDDFGLDRCDLIKVDVEGMEQLVLAGAAATIARTRPVLYLENNRRANSPELLQWMIDAGYRCYWHVISYFSTSNHAANPEDVFHGMLELNVLALPPGVACEIDGLKPIASADSWPDGIVVAPGV